jgi:hypothetical protein
MKLSLIVAVPLLALLAGCGAGYDRPDGAAATDPGRPAVTAQTLSAYRAVTQCIRNQGIKVPEPAVGLPFDSSAMDSLSKDDATFYDKVTMACPDYSKVVVSGG